MWSSFHTRCGQPHSLKFKIQSNQLHEVGAGLVVAKAAWTSAESRIRSIIESESALLGE